MKQWKNLNRLLGEKIENVSSHSRLLHSMTVGVRAALPAELAPHCTIDGYDDRRVVLLVDNSSYATLIYFHQQEILKKLNEEFTERTGCRFKEARLIVRDSD